MPCQRADSTPANEQHPIKALQWLAAQKQSGYVDDVLVLANHPLRLGIDAPYELRGRRDTGAPTTETRGWTPGSTPTRSFVDVV